MAGDATPNAQRRGWVLPSEPAAVRFMNTIWADRSGVHDDLRSQGDVVDWLRHAGLLRSSAGIAAGAADIEATRRLRDACRRLAAHATGDHRRAAASELDGLDGLRSAIEGVNTAAARRRPPQVALRNGRLTRTEAPDGEAVLMALAVLAAEAIDLVTDPDRPPLLACQAPGCVLYFVGDHPRRTWCSPACGNRARAARHYQRHRVATGR